MTSKMDCANWHVSWSPVNTDSDFLAWQFENFNLNMWMDGYRVLAPIGCFNAESSSEHSTSVYNNTFTYFNDCDSTCKEALLATNPLDRDGTVVHVSNGPLGGCGEEYTIESSNALASVKFECVCRCAASARVGGLRGEMGGL